MRRWIPQGVMWAICLFVVAGLQAPATGQNRITGQSAASRTAEARRQNEIRARVMQRDHERRAEEMKRDHERRVREMKAKPRSTSRSASSSSAKSKKKKRSTFNPQTASRPEDRVAAFVSTTRRATSLNEILPYLTQAKREYYQRLEDPARRLAALERYKQIAKKVRKLVSVHSRGDHATVEVSTKIKAVINAQTYTNSTATISLVGEGYDWQFESFEEGTFAAR